MIRRYKKAILARSERTQNELGETITTMRDIGMIDVAISLSTGSTSTINDVRAAQASHIGITPSDAALIGDRLAVGDAKYRIDFAHDLRRYTRLYLKREDEVNG